MKYMAALIFLIFVSYGCLFSNLNKEDVVQEYYKERNALSFKGIVAVIDDSLTVIEGDYVMPYDHQDFYGVFKWDSIFKPSYKLIRMAKEKDQIIASVELSSTRNQFLGNPTMTCDYKISFASDRISKIESLDCVGADWLAWQSKRDSLVQWINIHHPDLKGFINDMTMKGAQDYLKAIQLFENENN